MDILKDKFRSQRKSAAIRGIEWQFTYEEWLAWWGTDIVNRGRRRGQLVMARIGDTGSYSPDNVFKTTCSDNVRDGLKQRTYKTHSAETKAKISAKTAGRDWSHLKKPIMTPFGIFDSITAAHIASGKDIHYYLKNYPSQYFYIESAP